MPTNARRALRRLQDGNRRFVTDQQRPGESAARNRRDELLAGQDPFAIIIGCSDSRVPAELVFDQGLGDLFVVRVAGNVIAPSLVGSVEFAVEQFGTRLVVVMGHSSCGAVKVTLDVLESGDGSASPNLADIVDRIRSAIEPVYRRRSGMTADELMARAVRENVESSVRQLKAASESLARLSAEEDLLIVGAEYSLETGEVDFFSGLPDADPA